MRDDKLLAATLDAIVVHVADGAGEPMRSRGKRAAPGSKFVNISSGGKMKDTWCCASPSPLDGLVF